MSKVFLWRTGNLQAPTPENLSANSGILIKRKPITAGAASGGYYCYLFG
jgi:hypothetical protein